MKLEYESGRKINVFWFFGWWGTIFVQCDGEGWAYGKVAPKWYWGLRRIKSFLGIVWRVWDKNEDGSNYRISISTAWDVSRVAMGITISSINET